MMLSDWHLFVECNFDLKSKTVHISIIFCAIKYDITLCTQCNRNSGILLETKYPRCKLTTLAKGLKRLPFDEHFRFIFIRRNICF